MDYTKGPWTLKDNGAEFEIPEINVSWLRSFSDNREHDKEIRESKRGQIERANAQLMTAAPDMYEACLSALGLLAVENPGELPKMMEMVKSTLIKAINKAEGRTI